MTDLCRLHIRIWWNWKKLNLSKFCPNISVYLLTISISDEGRGSNSWARARRNLATASYFQTKVFALMTKMKYLVPKWFMWKLLHYLYLEISTSDTSIKLCDLPTFNFKSCNLQNKENNFNVPICLWKCFQQPGLE